MDLPAKLIRHGQINRCRTCGALIARRRKYCSRGCRAHFAERLALLVVTLHKIKARYASLTVGHGSIELVVMPWSGNHVSLFHGTFDPDEDWQWALFEFTIGLNERWHDLRKRWRSERVASQELLDGHRTDRWRKSHFDLDLSGPTGAVSRDLSRAMRALSIEVEDLRTRDFVTLLKARFAEMAHAHHPDRGAGDVAAFIRVKKARDILREGWESGELKALLSGEWQPRGTGNPMPWSFFFDGYTGRWHFPD